MLPQVTPGIKSGNLANSLQHIPLDDSTKQLQTREYEIFESITAHVLK